MRYFFVFLILLMAACKKDKQQPAVSPRVPVIINLEKDKAQEGDTLSLTGKDLQADGLQPQLLINGRTAEVLAASAETLKFVVPSKVRTGPVVIFLGNATVEGPTLTIIPAAVVGSFSPRFVLPGDELTLTGTNFATPATNNDVFIGGKLATVISGSSTELKVRVPDDAVVGDLRWRVYGGPMRTYGGDPLLVRQLHYDATNVLDYLRQDPGFSFIYGYIIANESFLAGRPARDTIMAYLTGTKTGTLFIPNNYFGYNAGRNTQLDINRFYTWYDFFCGLLGLTHNVPVAPGEWVIDKRYRSELSAYMISGGSDEARDYFSVYEQDGVRRVGPLSGSGDVIGTNGRIIRSFTVAGTVVYEIDFFPYYESQPF